MSKLKENIQAHGGFKHWFSNVFWYHYKWPVIVAVVVLTVVVYTTVDAIRTPRYDAKIAVVTNRTVTEEQLEEVRDVVAAALGDVNGDGKTNIFFRLANLSDEEYAAEYREMFFTCLSDPDYAVYLMDDATSALYTSSAMDYFDSLEAYGLPCDADNPCRLSLKDNELMQRSEISDLYLCILDLASGSDGDSDGALTEQTLTLVHALLGDQAPAS